MYLFCSMALLLYPPSPAPRLARGIGHRLKRLTNHLTDLDRERSPTALPNGTGRLVLLLYYYTIILGIASLGISHSWDYY